VHNECGLVISVCCFLLIYARLSEHLVLIIKISFYFVERWTIAQYKL
jgi:hypothetical protein